MGKLAFPRPIIIEREGQSLSTYYKLSKVENRKKTFSTKITWFTKVSCLTKLKQPIKLTQLVTVNLA